MQTIAQTHQLAAAGAGIVRIALDNEKEVAALKGDSSADPRALRCQLIYRKTTRLPAKSHHTSTRSVTTPAICII